MTFYDDYTTATFAATYARSLPVFLDGNALPSAYPQECAFLAGLIGSFTDSIMDFVRQTLCECPIRGVVSARRNEAPLNGGVNLPRSNWTPSKIDCLKTENFTFTGDRDLNKAERPSRCLSNSDFRRKSAHLIGIGDYTTPWQKESRMAHGARLASVVLFALDQFCLIGYAPPPDLGSSAQSVHGRAEVGTILVGPRSKRLQAVSSV